MTKYLDPSFNSPANNSKYVSNYDRVFSKEHQELEGELEELSMQAMDLEDGWEDDLAEKIEALNAEAGAHVAKAIQDAIEPLLERIAQLESDVLDLRDIHGL